MSKVMSIPPSQEEIWNEELELVDTKQLFSKDYTERLREVYHRECDNTFWAVEFDKSHDGDYNQLRDDKVQPYQVVPKEVVTTIYIKGNKSGE
jgi:hypothetical protein